MWNLSISAGAICLGTTGLSLSQAVFGFPKTSRYKTTHASSLCQSLLNFFCSCGPLQFGLRGVVDATQSQTSRDPGAAPATFTGVGALSLSNSRSHQRYPAPGASSSRVSSLPKSTARLSPSPLQLLSRKSPDIREVSCPPFRVGGARYQSTGCHYRSVVPELWLVQCNTSSCSFLLQPVQGSHPPS